MTHSEGRRSTSAVSLIAAMAAGLSACGEFDVEYVRLYGIEPVDG